MDLQTQKYLRELVKKNYEEIAEDFNETRQKIIWPELIKLSESVNRGETVLDAGCGNGRLLQAFKLKPVKYVGLDFNKKFIDFANEQWAVPDGEFICGDILECSKVKCSITAFDHVFCIAVIHNIPGHDLRVRAVKELACLAKPDGRIVISAWNLWNKWKYLKLIIKFNLARMAGRDKMDCNDILFDWKKGIISQRYYHAFTKRELRKLASDAGMKIEMLYKDKYNYYLVLKK
jgi:SAM-dependent methyltransferase